MRASLIIALALAPTFLGLRARADARPSAGAAPHSQGSAFVRAPAAAAGVAQPPLDDAAGTAHRGGRERSFAHPSAEGLIGGVHLVDASSAEPGTFRVGLNGNFFRKDGFIAPRDQHRYAGALLNLSLTPIAHLEVAAQLATYSSENLTSQTSVVQVVGDAHVLAKAFAAVLPWLTVAGDADLALLNGVGSIGVSGAATSFGLRASASADLSAVKKRLLPLRVRTNLRYLFDNSARLVREIEDSRYASLSDPAPRRDEYRHLVSAAERYALQVNRVDRFGAGLGVEAPLHPHERVYVSPLLEWSFALPVNRQQYDCVVTQLANQRDGCLAREGFGARPSALTIGVRAQPYVPGLALLLALDVATTGSRTFVRELAPMPRYLLYFGASYAYDPRPSPAPAVRVERVEIKTGDLRGHIVGQVVESQTGAPVSGAIVHFEGTSVSDVVSDGQGMFRSAELAPGAHGMRTRAPGFREALCVAVLPTSGEDVSARCELTPGEHYGVLLGRVADSAGKPITNAHVVLRGPQELLLTSSADGSFRSAKLLEGEYDAQVEAEGHFSAHARVRIDSDRESTPALVLYPRPKQPRVWLAGKRILMQRTVQFEASNAVLKGESLGLLAELADLLHKHPELAQIEIQGHVDQTPDEKRARALSEQRAQVVREWLIAQGVSGARLTAVGYGSTQPIAPNITALNRARNRRIAFVFR